MPSYFLRGAQLIDGTGKDPVENGGVVFADGRITSVGKATELDVPKNTKTIDVGRKTIMPGMIDAHTHISFPTYGAVTDIASGSLESLSMFAVFKAKLFLFAGFTTIRDLASIGTIALALRDAIKAGNILGPRIKTTGKFIFPTGGGVEYVADGPFPLVRRADGPSEVIKAVRDDIKAGADFIKMEATGACDSPIAPAEMQTYTYDEMLAGVREAHRHKKSIAFHAEGSEGIKSAVKAGADSIEHGFHIDKGTIRTMREKGVFLVPTIGMVGTRLEKDWPDKLPKYLVDGSRAAFGACKETLAKCNDTGVKVAVGADAGGVSYPSATSARELEYMVDFGYSNLDAITAATKVSSEVSEVSNEVGTLEVGKFADILVVNGDPLKDIKILQNWNAISVVKNGEFTKGFS